MTIFSLPKHYAPPRFTPLYWRDETSGVLPAAIKSYIYHMADRHSAPPATEQVELIIAYLQYFINAPCWVGGEQLEELRQSVKQLYTLEDIETWVETCLKIALDPF